MPDRRELFAMYRQRRPYFGEILSEYEFIDKKDSDFLGNGAFAVVVRATLKIEKKFAKPVDPNIGVAIKVIFKANITDKQLLQREISLMNHVTNHPGICTLFEVWETQEELFLVMQFLPGVSLSKWMENTVKPVSEKQAAEIIGQVLLGLHFCEMNCIAHRDIKPENIMLDTRTKFSVGDTLDTSTFNVQIIDFGLGKSFEGVDILSTARGTPYFVAPEVISGRSYTAACDLWSLGVVVYQLLSADCEQLPFIEDDQPTLLQAIREMKYQMPQQDFGHLSSQGKDFIQRFLTDSQHRITAQGALSHPWFKLHGLDAAFSKLYELNLKQPHITPDQMRETQEKAKNLSNNNSTPSSNTPPSPRKKGFSKFLRIFTKN